MQATYHEVRTNRGWTICLCLLTVIVLATACTVSQSQTLIGSPGAGWQTWSVTPISSDQPDLMTTERPGGIFQWNSAGNHGTADSPTAGADKNPGFCMTATGDCVGIASGAFAPGALPFWAMPYDSVADNPTGPAPGARDNKVYFRSFGSTLRATLYLNATANPNEVNDFGWFSTNSSGTIVGTRHKLFGGTGVT